MVAVELVRTLTKPRLNTVLLFAQACLDERQFLAFRRMLLDEFGKKGLEGQLIRVEQESRSQERHGRE